MSDTITFVVLLVLGILAINVAVWSVVLFFLRRRTRQIAAEWAAQGLGFRRGPEMATYRGHASVAIPARGNGLLALTDRDLRLMRIVPRREFVIPLAQITKIEQVRAWKGSYKAGRPVIVVYYHDTGTSTAQDDAIGFSVRDSQAWLEALNAAAKNT